MRKQSSFTGALVSVRDGYVEIQILKKEFLQAKSTQICLSIILYITQVKFIGLHFPLKRNPLDDDIFLSAQAFFWEYRRSLWRLKSQIASHSTSLCAHRMMNKIQTKRSTASLECISCKATRSSGHDLHVCGQLIETNRSVLLQYQAHIADLSQLTFEIEDMDIFPGAEQEVLFEQLIECLEDGRKIPKSRHFFQKENAFFPKWNALNPLRSLLMEDNKSSILFDETHQEEAVSHPMPLKLEPSLFFLSNIASSLGHKRSLSICCQSLNNSSASENSNQVANSIPGVGEGDDLQVLLIPKGTKSVKYTIVDLEEEKNQSQSNGFIKPLEIIDLG